MPFHIKDLVHRASTPLARPESSHAAVADPYECIGTLSGCPCIRIIISRILHSAAWSGQKVQSASGRGKGSAAGIAGEVTGAAAACGTKSNSLGQAKPGDPGVRGRDQALTQDTLNLTVSVLREENCKISCDYLPQ
jgi:hypothetical protein